MKQDKKNTITSSIATLLLLLVTINATYAYFSSTISKTNANFITTTDAQPTFTAYAQDRLALNVSGADMSGGSTTPVKSDNATIIVSLSSSSTSVVHCTYDVEFVWETAGYTTPTTTLTSPYLYELSIKAQQSVTGDTTGQTYSVTSLSEKNLSSFSWSNNGQANSKATLIKNAEIYSKSTTATKATWTFTVNFYSLPTDQSSLLGKSYGAHLQVTNVTC